MKLLRVMADDDPDANTYLPMDAVGCIVHDVIVDQAWVFDREGRSPGWTLQADLEHVSDAYLPAGGRP